MGGPIFACHKTPEGRERPCTGWLAAVGWNHLTVRYWVIVARLIDPSALTPKPDWPDLFDDYDELIKTQAAPDTDAETGDEQPGNLS